jgi:prepilin-type N-terminal cleavage/methylation domain-containing protein
MDKKSFTLVELIVVIAIIAILTGVISVNVFKAILKARIARTAADLKTVKTATLAYYVDVGEWPNTTGIPSGGYVTGQHPLLTNSGVLGWDGPYLETPAMSPLAKPPGVAGCPQYGVYFVIWQTESCPEGVICNIYWHFDLDSDGTAEILDGVGVGVYGFADTLTVEKLDDIFDDTSVVGPYPMGRIGNMNTLDTACSMRGLVCLYIGRSGETHP